MVLQRVFTGAAKIVFCMTLMASTALCADTNCDISRAFIGKNAAEVKTFLSAAPRWYPPYQVFVHSPLVSPHLQSIYTLEQLDQIERLTADIRHLQLTSKPWGTFLKATSFVDEQTESETHYNAVWVRDSLWGYLALNTEKERKKEAINVLLTLWDYLSVPAQIERMKKVIQDPSLLDSENGQMMAVHIRFDSDSKDFNDVIDNGEVQSWNHKQNDALGLALDLIIRSISDGQMMRMDWHTEARMNALILLVAYFDRARFDQMQDSGAWEEDARLNTSSVALVTSGLESLQRLLSDKTTPAAIAFTADFNKSAKRIGLSRYVTPENINTLIDRGYEKITHQLTLGGESPDYRRSDLNYRTADAALLNLIYPAKLSRLTLNQKKQVLEIVRSLTGAYGIKRYLKDNYQSANFWFNNIRTDTSDETQNRRVESFIPFTEAQWFFDSWYATASALVYQESNDPYYLSETFQYMNRSLGQITGDDMLGANARPVPARALPESYNLIATTEQSLLPAPSPIIPLNWAKASLTLMLEQLRITISGHDTH